MPHQMLKLLPGVNTNKTIALNEAALSSSNLIRFIPDQTLGGLPQKLGGWTQFVKNWTSATPIKALLAWEDTNNNPHLAIGAEDALYVASGDPLVPVDISPQIYTANVSLALTTVAGSNRVLVGDVGSHITGFDAVYVATQITIGGLVLYGLYPAFLNSADSYYIYATDVLGNPQYATSSVGPAGAVPVFDTTSGSETVAVTLADHGLSVGSNFPVFVSTSAGGLTLYGNYTVDSVTSSSVFSFLAQNQAGSNATVSMNSGSAQYIYYIGSGVLPTSTGYGVGGYGGGGYGTGTASASGRVFATTAASGTGTVATLSFSGNWTVPVGAQIVVAGVTPAGYNGIYTVTANTPGGTTTVSFASTTTGVQTVAGTITVTYWPFNLGETATNKDWTLDNWGEVLIACDFNGGIYQWSPISGAFNATILPYGPATNHGAIVAMPQRQIIAWGSTFNGLHDPLLIRWCDVNNYDDWIGKITNQAGSYRLSKGSKIVACLQAAQQTLVWTDLGIWSMQYVGQPFVYQFSELGTGCGLIARKACAAVGGTVYWMGQSQFYRLSGNGVEPVGCPVWDVIFQDIDMDYKDNIRVAVNSRFGEISWFYPITGSAGVNTKYVKYNITIDKWDFGTLTRTAWINESIYGPPIGAADGIIYQHETSTDAAGQPMLPTMQTGYFALSDADQKVFVDEVWPDMKWGYYGGTQNANVQITFYGADFPGQTPITYGPYTVTQATKWFNPRIRARLLAIEISSTDSGSFWRLGGIRYRSQPDGRY